MDAHYHPLFHQYSENRLRLEGSPSIGLRFSKKILINPMIKSSLIPVLIHIHKNTYSDTFGKQRRSLIHGITYAFCHLSGTGTLKILIYESKVMRQTQRDRASKVPKNDQTC